MPGEFRARVPEGSITGWLAGDGPPVLVLHGGPGLSALAVLGCTDDIDSWARRFDRTGLRRRGQPAPGSSSRPSGLPGVSQRR